MAESSLRAVPDWACAAGAAGRQQIAAPRSTAARRGSEWDATGTTFIGESYFSLRSMVSCLRESKELTVRMGPLRSAFSAQIS